MTTDFRALCKELLSALEDEASNWNLDPEDHPLVIRARAALAAEPEPPVNGEVAELVVWLRCHASSKLRIQREQFLRAADLLERLALQPVPEGPSDEELVNFRNRATADCCASRSNNGANLLSGDDLVECQAAGLRAVLARWGHAPNA